MKIIINKITIEVDNEKVRQIIQIKALQDIFGILNDLTIEEINIFDEAVKRRWEWTSR